jgi:hypothetical protein
MGAALAVAWVNLFVEIAVAILIAFAAVADVASSKSGLKSTKGVILGVITLVLWSLLFALTLESMNSKDRADTILRRSAGNAALAILLVIALGLIIFWGFSSGGAFWLGLGAFIGALVVVLTSSIMFAVTQCDTCNVPEP